ncbi:MAG: hypothetical protein AUG08_06255 [Acidobacteria bacterium 13_1_20CM_2_55_15]|nr:MAG: hypothetical protein AUH28_20735 [Acidobacteria bacterium 13_1_40CM_56_16]OLD68503.1 MAG: hypothetical protein AUI45_10370 [Acidobacteria bacterium 13_1_40CM_2_56_11]OLE88921.1 MAG: hypothetical protein AUG08_06255 [Acidobacteria bacterium 13_1_20CM_2_55_15]
MPPSPGAPRRPLPEGIGLEFVLKDIQTGDIIRLTTLEDVKEYRVVSTKVVPPTDTSALDDAISDKTLVLVTCYPFYYIGPAPKRFVVEAVKD